MDEQTRLYQLALFCGYVLLVGCIAYWFAAGHPWRQRVLFSVAQCLWTTPLIARWMEWHYHWPT